MYSLHAVVNDCGFLEKRVSFFGGKKRSKLGRDLQAALWHLMVCELITCSKLPSKWSLFGKVKFHLCSKNSVRQGREKMMVSVVRLAMLPTDWLFGTGLEDVL